MLKKLSKKERGEVVTKGYLEDLNYVSKSYLDNRFEKFRKEINEDFKTHTAVLMEDNHNTIKMLIEAFENRFERIERKLDIV